MIMSRRDERHIDLIDVGLTAGTLVKDLPLSDRALVALKAGSWRDGSVPRDPYNASLIEIARDFTEAELLRIPGFGRSSLAGLLYYLAEAGLKMGYPFTGPFPTKEAARAARASYPLPPGGVYRAAWYCKGTGWGSSENWGVPPCAAGWYNAWTIPIRKGRSISK